MRSRKRLPLLAVLCLLMLALNLRGEAAGHPPDILLITIDTLRADHLSCLGGSVQTPFLDWLAAQGTLYENAYSQCDRTAMSHMSILTSRYPSHILHGQQPFSTLPEILQQRGYRTVAVPSTAMLNPESTVSRQPRPLSFGLGFDEYFELRPTHVNGDGVGYHERTGAETTALAADWLRSAPQPFFMWMHLYTCHGPRQVGPDSAAAMRFSDDRAEYAAAVAYTDTLVGQVLEALQASGSLGHTTVIVTADHGESLGEHELTGHAGLYEPILRVPLIVYSPSSESGVVGRGRGVRVSSPVQNVDVAPTLLGAPLPFGDGKLLPTHTVASPPSVFAESRNLECRMVLEGGKKFIEYETDLIEPILPTPNPPGWYERRSGQDSAVYRPAGLRELYDLRQDAAEAHNRIAEAPADVEHLRGVAMQRLGKLQSATVMERMRAVGY